MRAQMRAQMRAKIRSRSGQDQAKIWLGQIGEMVSC
jgi:hypothetical protein